MHPPAQTVKSEYVCAKLPSSFTMSLQSYLPSSSSPYFSKSIEVVNDLTDRVFKTESWSFAYGGNGDIWKANLVQKDSGHTMVQTYFVACWHSLKHSIFISAGGC